MQDLHRMVDIAENKSKKNPKLRKGDILFNLVDQEYGHITSKLRNTEYDPSRNNLRIPKFLGKVKQELKKH